MADDADRAAQYEQDERDAAIRAARDNRLYPAGCCRYCLETFPIGDTRIYCDRDCEDDHNRLERARRMRAVE